MNDTSMSAKLNVLVIGAGGFIGGRICEILYLHQLAKPRAGVRVLENACRVARLPIEIRKCDVLEPDQIAQSLENIDVVINCVHPHGNPNVSKKGLKNIIRCSFSKNIKQLIHLSTIEIYGNPSGMIHETQSIGSQKRSDENSYQAIKINAEDICWSYIDQNKPITIVRPSYVHGPFSEYWTIQVVNKLSNGEWDLSGVMTRGKCNLVYVDDLVRAILILMNNEDAMGEAFHVNGPQIITWKEYFDKIKRKIGISSTQTKKPSQESASSSIYASNILNMPVTLNKIFKKASLSLEKFPKIKKFLNKLPFRNDKEPAEWQVKVFERDCIYSIDKIKKLGFVPRVRVDNGLDRSLKWMRFHSMID